MNKNFKTNVYRSVFQFNKDLSIFIYVCNVAITSSIIITSRFLVCPIKSRDSLRITSRFWKISLPFFGRGRWYRKFLHVLLCRFPKFFWIGNVFKFSEVQSKICAKSLLIVEVLDRWTTLTIRLSFRISNNDITHGYLASVLSVFYSRRKYFGIRIVFYILEETLDCLDWILLIFSI